MDVTELCEWGESIPRDDLKITQAVAFANAIDKYPFAKLVEVRRDGDFEGLVVDFEPELPQRPIVPILTRERLLVAVGPDDNKRPEVLALRRGFPDVPHLNLTPKDAPKELCIFEEDYREVKSRLTPRRLLDRIADWLARAATEELHLPDQPLEPFLMTSDRIIFDRDVSSTDLSNPPVIVVLRLSENPNIFRAIPLPEDADKDEVKKRCALHLVLPLKCRPWNARLLNHQPDTLANLSQLLLRIGTDIEDEIRRLISHIHTEGKLGDFGTHQLILILKLPKTRTPGGSVESTEWWAFIIDVTIEGLAIKLGLMKKTEGRLGLLLAPHKSEDLDDVQLAPLIPTFSLSKDFARRLSGDFTDDPKLTMIGAGTLGSQVALHLARQGFGAWVIIDDDNLLPHNFPRHALPASYQGYNKSLGLANEIRELLNDEDAAKAVCADVLRKGNAKGECRNALESADAILDFSASHGVAGFLAHADYTAPSVCSFLSPNARYLILLAEGQDRLVRADDLEIQLKAAIAENDHLADLFVDEARTVPYAGSCRDASAQLPQDVVAIHAGAAANFIKNRVFAIAPTISLWKWCSTTFSLTHHDIPVHTVDVKQVADWTLRVSSHAIHQMRYYRRRHLPNETGGVVLGQMDLGHKTIYVATVLPSPPDSVEWPNLYIRGTKGLQAKVDRATEVTRGDLCYIGEWHSHPDEGGSDPSADDRQALRRLAQEMGEAGLPGLVLIQGKRYNPRIMVELAE